MTTQTSRCPPSATLRGLVLLVACVAAAPTPACTVDVAPLSFGNVNPLDHIDADSVTMLTVTCPNDTAYSATVNAGSSSYADRRMTGAQGSLGYQLYTEASRSLIWGDGSAGTSNMEGTAGATGSAHSIYGRIPSQPMAIPGAYSDTLLVTVSY